MSYVLLGGAQNKNNTLRVVAYATVLAVLFSLASPVLAMAAPEGGVAANHDMAVSDVETYQALKNTPGVLENSDQVITRSDGDSAAATSAVDVPKDAAAGVGFGALSIDLPNANAAGVAGQVAPGVVGYDAGNGSANAVQTTEDGGVRMLTIIDHPNAPTSYEYHVSVPGDNHIELLSTGGAVVLSGGGETVATVATPWAKDAEGAVVETYFTTDGHTLTQHVSHNVPGVAYPVVADPFWQTAWKKAQGAWSTFNGRKITQCFASGILISTGVLTTLVAAPVSMGSSTILGIAIIGGSAEYVKCRLG
jgi:hypothetical protein